MSKRSYNQFCAVARTLDHVGERWTLLLIRELLTGPKRFKDLLVGLRGMGTNLLSTRLKQLEEDGIVQRIILSPPAKVPAYELTERGWDLEPVLLELLRWGLPLLAKGKMGDYSRPIWDAIGMKVIFNPEAAKGVRETYEFRIDDDVFHANVRDETVIISQGHAETPDLIITTDSKIFSALARRNLDLDEAIRDGILITHGDKEVLLRCLAMFELPGAAI